LKPLYTQRPCETTETQKTYKQKIERKNNISFGSLRWYFSFDFAFLGGWKGHQTKTENLRTLITEAFRLRSGPICPTWERLLQHS